MHHSVHSFLDMVPRNGRLPKLVQTSNWRPPSDSPLKVTYWAPKLALLIKVIGIKSLLKVWLHMKKFVACDSTQKFPRSQFFKFGFWIPFLPQLLAYVKWMKTPEFANIWLQVCATSVDWSCENWSLFRKMKIERSACPLSPATVEKVMIAYGFFYSTLNFASAVCFILDLK